MQQSLETLCALIEAHAAEIDAERRLTPEVVDALRKAGAFRMLMPEKFGGLAIVFEDYLEIIQALAGADASTAWCVNQAAVIGTTSLWLPAAKITEIWSTPETSVANGPPIDCLLKPLGQDAELTGHWGFSSGCQHATWMTGAARYSEGGWRIAYFRPGDVEFDDTWQVAGLRGTGSFEFRCKALPIEAEQVADMGQPATVDIDITKVPSALLFAVSFAAVALGVAEGATKDVLAIAQGKVPKYASLAVKDDPDVQRFIGKAIARWRGARAYLYDTAGRVMSATRATGDITHGQRAELRMVGTHVIQECAKVLDAAYKVAGSTGIYQHQTLQRRFQDMHVITQHVQARESYFALLGRYAMSGDYETGPMT